MVAADRDAAVTVAADRVVAAEEEAEVVEAEEGRADRRQRFFGFRNPPPKNSNLSS